VTGVSAVMGDTGLTGPTGASGPTGVTGVSAPFGAVPAASRPTANGMTALQHDLYHVMRLAGTQSGAYVYDLTAGHTLFALRSTVAHPPASVEKLFTSVAVLKELGADARLQTTVLGVGHWEPGGVFDGDLYLRGGGDPSFGTAAFNHKWEDGLGASLDNLVDKLVKRDGLRAVTGKVIGDGSLFDGLPGGPASDYEPDIPDIGGELDGLTFDHGMFGDDLTPAGYAAQRLAHALAHEGVSVTASRTTAVTPAGAMPLASVASPPISDLLGLMNRPSDDFYAELLAEQLGARFGGAGSIAAGAKVIEQVLATYGLHPQIVDGSGLSREDSATPREVVSLLRAVAPTSLGATLVRSLPLAGVTGTLADRMGHSPAYGRCRAKTGTLNEVSNLAGYCTSGDGHTIVFALFMDGLSEDYAHTLQDSFAITLARDSPSQP
jgi:D-alanyl-D-alanine carboxypeptidase/D-alanyl-D-alanine-endopeptidase (penicillin-binding protein 4)